MTFLKSLIVIALFSITLFSPARSFAQLDPHRPSQPISPKLPVTLILDQADRDTPPQIPPQERISEPLPLLPKESSFTSANAILISRGPTPNKHKTHETTKTSKDIKK